MSEILLTPTAETPADERATLGRRWWLVLVLGLVSIFVGLVAISSTVLVTLASVKVFGVLLLIAGVTEVVHAIMVRNLKGFALHLLGAALYLFVGVFMLEDPLRAAAVLTLLLAANFLVAGFLRIVSALSVQFAGWPWVLLNGVVDLILGGMIWSEWPGSSLWVIGLFLGIDLLFHGWSWVFMALTVRRARAIPSAGAGL
jgi:uncharacterized membrane protein HdeD (DUF308 family)